MLSSLGHALIRVLGTWPRPSQATFPDLGTFSVMGSIPRIEVPWEKALGKPGKEGCFCEWHPHHWWGAIRVWTHWCTPSASTPLASTPLVGGAPSGCGPMAAGYKTICMLSSLLFLVKPYQQDLHMHLGATTYCACTQCKSMIGWAGSISILLHL